MEGSTQEQQRRIRKSQRFGFLAIVLLFLSALFSSVGISFLIVFGSAGIYCAFLWFYFSYQPTPKARPFEYGNAGYSGSGTSQHSGRRGFLIMVGGMIFIFLVALWVFTNDPAEEPQVSDDSTPVAKDYSVPLKRDPNDIDALTNAGNFFFENGSYDSALYYYDRILRIDANNSPALYNKSLVLYNQKDFSGAASLSLRCVQIDPSNADAFMLLGDCYQEQSNLDLALTQYNKAYELGARTPGLSNTLAYIYDTKGSTDKAISFYKETLEQDSSRTDVYTRLAELDPERKLWYAKKAEEWKAK